MSTFKSRSGFKLIQATLTALLCLGIAAPAHSDGDLTEGSFIQRVKAALGSGTVQDHSGFVLEVIREDGTVDLHLGSNADRQFYPASSIKTLIALTCLSKMNHNGLTLDHTLLWPGRGQVSLREVIRQMLAWSDNDAANVGIEWVGRPALAWAAKQLQFKAELPVRVSRLLNGTNDPHPRNSASAQGLADLYYALATGKGLGPSGLGLTPADLNFIRDVLTIQTSHNDYAFGAGYGDVPGFAGIKVYHKPGYTSTSSSDGGYFRLPEDGRIVILTYLQDFASKPNLKAYGLVVARFLRDLSQ